MWFTLPWFDDSDLGLPFKIVILLIVVTIVGFIIYFLATIKTPTCVNYKVGETVEGGCKKVVTDGKTCYQGCPKGMDGCDSMTCGFAKTQDDICVCK